MLRTAAKLVLYTGKCNETFDNFITLLNVKEDKKWIQFQACPANNRKCYMGVASSTMKSLKESKKNVCEKRFLELKTLMLWDYLLLYMPLNEIFGSFNILEILSSFVKFFRLLRYKLHSKIHNLARIIR